MREWVKKAKDDMFESEAFEAQREDDLRWDLKKANRRLADAESDFNKMEEILEREWKEVEWVDEVLKTGTLGERKQALSRLKALKLDDNYEQILGVPGTWNWRQSSRSSINTSQ